jgi:hypothetical protein
MSRFSAKWSEVVDMILARNLKLSGIQVDNEFNSAAFNGDLPLVSGGAILGEENHQQYAFWTNFHGGMVKLVAVLRVVSTSLKKSDAYKNVPVVLGGLARPTNTWLRNVDASLVEPSLTLRTLRSLGADVYVDAYAIHIYPQVSRSKWTTPTSEIRDYVNKRMLEVTEVTGLQKQWWITEWGFASTDFNRGRCAEPDPRLPLFLEFARVIADSSWRSLIKTTFIYDWDESRNFRIWDGRSVLCTYDFFDRIKRLSTSTPNPMVRDAEARPSSASLRKRPGFRHSQYLHDRQNARKSGVFA